MSCIQCKSTEPTFLPDFPHTDGFLQFPFYQPVSLSRRQPLVAQEPLFHTGRRAVHHHLHRNKGKRREYKEIQLSASRPRSRDPHVTVMSLARSAVAEVVLRWTGVQRVQHNSNKDSLLSKRPLPSSRVISKLGMMCEPKHWTQKKNSFHSSNMSPLRSDRTYPIKVPARPRAGVVVSDVDLGQRAERVHHLDVEDVGATARELAALQPDLATRLLTLLPK